MGVTKLVPAEFQRLDRQLTSVVASVPVMFNPSEFTLNKGVQITEIPIPGLDMPILQFVRGQTETLSLDLFFDTTEDGMGGAVTAVTIKTDLFYQLIKIDRDTHAPPVCRFVWGEAWFPGANFTDNWASQQRENGFQCVVESVRQRFTLFSPDGAPLRATLSLSLKEYQTLDQQLTMIDPHSAERTTVHVVQRGESLSQIARLAYGDPGRWRPIADANAIADPLRLAPGAVLTIPALAATQGA
jgi:hypothetical protein